MKLHVDSMKKEDLHCTKQTEHGCVWSGNAGESHDGT